MHYTEYFRLVENSITNVVRACHPASWDENHIIYSLCDELFRNHRCVSVDGFDRPFKIIWDFRKLRLPEESDFETLVPAPDHLERARLWKDWFEAKRRDLGKEQPAAKTSQIKRIVSKAPSARLLAQLLLYGPGLRECV